MNVRLALMSLLVFSSLISAVPAMADQGTCLAWVDSDHSMYTVERVNDDNALGECRENMTWQLGDNYCNGLRAGRSGPNPVYLRYQAAYSDATYAGDGNWTFYCADVPQR